MQTHTGSMKAKLEEVGVKFSKSANGVWYAEVDGQTIGRDRELTNCIKQAAKAYGD